MKISKEVQVGFFMVITIGLLYFGFNYLRGVEFFDENTKYYAKYTNVGGLTVSNAVTISGYSVGRISDVRILQNDSNKVIVEMTVNGDIVFGKGAKAILDVGLLGDPTIKVEPGDISQPAQAGDTLHSELGAGVIEMFTGTVEPVASSIQSAIVRVNTILQKWIDSEQQLQNTMDNIEATTANSKMLVQEIRVKLTDMVIAYNEVIKNVDDGVAQLSPVIRKYGELADSLKAIDVQPVLNTTEKTLADLDVLIKKIETSEGTLNSIIEDKELYDNLNRTILHLDSILTHFESRPKDFLAPLGRDKPKGRRK